MLTSFLEWYIKESQDTRFLNYNDRIKIGKGVEKDILGQLRERGLNIQDPTANQDMFDKIDGILINGPKGTGGIQIKYREERNDILFELERNGKLGRDAKSKAVYYGVVPPGGKEFLLYEYKAIRQIIDEAFEDFMDSDQSMRPKGMLDHRNGVLIKKGNDPSDGANKTYAIVSLYAVNPLKKIKINLY